MVLDLWIDGSEVANYAWPSTPDDQGDVSVYQDASTGEYIMAFDNGVVAKIAVALETMTVSMIMPSDLQGATLGLMGMFTDVYCLLSRCQDSSIGKSAESQSKVCKPASHYCQAFSLVQPFIRPITPSC